MSLNLDPKYLRAIGVRSDKQNEKTILRFLLEDPRTETLEYRLVKAGHMIGNFLLCLTLDGMEKDGLIKLWYIKLPRRRKRPIRIYYYAVTKRGSDLLRGDQ